MSEPIHDITPLGDLAEIVAGNIRAEVARFGLDQMEIAAALGTSQTAVSNRLNGKIRWQLDDIEALAGMLEIEPYELLIPPRTYKKSARRVASAPAPADTAEADNSASRPQGTRTPNLRIKSPELYH